MGTDQTKAIISGGITGSLVVTGTAFKLAFPDMIVPFEWALALLVAGLLGFASTAVFGVRAYFKKPKLKQPQLQPSLQTQYRGNDAWLSFEIKNLGPGDVDLESYEISTGDGFKISLHVDLLTFVPEGGSVTLNPQRIFRRDLENAARLRMNFRTKDGGGCGTVAYSFPISVNGKPTSLPSSWKQHLGHDLTPEATMEHIRAHFLRAEGTQVLIPKRFKEDGSFNKYVTETENRRFYFDPENLFVRFETQSKTTIRRVTGHLPESGQATAYLIFLCWSDATQEMEIRVHHDGELKIFSDCETIYLITEPSWNSMQTPASTRS